jgi:hypothetical protein
MSLTPVGKRLPGLEEAVRNGGQVESDGAVTREQRHSRRKRVVRARTISIKRITRRELDICRLLYPEGNYWKPRTRAECVDAPRPCPFISCKHHLFVDVSARTGSIKINFPDLEIWEMNESCALDVADRGGTTLEDVGAIMNLTGEGIRQVEVKALTKVKALAESNALRDYADDSSTGGRRLPQLDETTDERDEERETDDAVLCGQDVLFVGRVEEAFFKQSTQSVNDVDTENGTATERVLPRDPIGSRARRASIAVESRGDMDGADLTESFFGLFEECLFVPAQIRRALLDQTQKLVLGDGPSEDEDPFDAVVHDTRESDRSKSEKS